MSTPAKLGLSLRGMRAGYGATIIIDGIDLDIAPGTTLCVLGRNGVGKTTLFGSIVGRTTHHGGDVALDGSSLISKNIYQRVLRGIGLVPQEREIFRSLTVEENLEVSVRPGRWTVERVYDFFPSLAARKRNRGDQLSGGEQQMLAIGRALLGNPKYLLMDEPMEGLAPVVVDLVLAGMHRIRREDDMAIVLVEQHARLALEFASDCLILDRGRIAWQSKSRVLLDDPQRLASLVGVAR